MACVLGIALAFAPPPAAAHPHVWASVRSDIVLGPGDTVTAIRHTWTFDEFYSAMALQGLDTDGDGVYSKDELKPLADVNIKSLKDFDFFTYASADGAPVALKEPVDYWVSEDKAIVTLHFTLPLVKPVSAKAESFKMQVYDPTFFVAFGFAKKDPVRVAGSESSPCKIALTMPDPDNGSGQALTEAFFTQLGPNSNYGSQFSQTAVLTCK